MPFSPAFLRIRAIAFSLIILISLVWVSLLSVYVSMKWEMIESTERSLLAVMLLVDAATPIVLLILLILVFRPWLDAARFLFLTLAQFGIAGAFAYWFPKLKCPNTSADAQSVCEMVNMFVLMASWVIPALLVTYAGGLAYAMFCESRRPPQLMMERESIIPVMRPPNSRTVSYSTTSSTRDSAENQRKHISGLTTLRSSTQSLAMPPPIYFRPQQPHQM